MADFWLTDNYFIISAFFTKTCFTNAGPFLAVYCVIMAHNHLPFFKISSAVYFCPNFQIFCLFCPLFLPFFWKIAPMPLISRIGSKIWLQVLHLFYRVVIRSDGEKLRNKVIKNNSIGLKLNLPTKNLPKNIYFFGPVWTVFVESRLNFRVLYLKSFTFALYYLFERPAKLLIWRCKFCDNLQSLCLTKT